MKSRIDYYVKKVAKAKSNVHNRLISALELRLKQDSNIDYTRIDRTQEYGPYHSPTGEIDLLAIKNNYVLLFEMKSTDSQRNYHKAREQLERAENHCSICKNQRVFKFYVTPRSIKWIKTK